MDQGKQFCVIKRLSNFKHWIRASSFFVTNNETYYFLLLDQGEQFLSQSETLTLSNVSDGKRPAMKLLSPSNDMWVPLKDVVLPEMTANRLGALWIRR